MAKRRPQDPSEASIVKSIMAYLNGIDGCKAEKRHGGPMGKKGEPDISACYQGLRLEIEVKRPGEQPTPLQAKRLAEWAEAGAVALVATSKEDVQAVILEIQKAHADEKIQGALRRRREEGRA